MSHIGFTYSFDASACQECAGFCCRGRTGHVWITDLELRALSSFLAMNTVDFISRFVDRINNRLSLKEVHVDGNYNCIFFDTPKNGCSVYAVRPMQCRRFPFWEEYKNRLDEIMLECPGVLAEPEPGRNS